MRTVFLGHEFRRINSTTHRIHRKVIHPNVELGIHLQIRGRPTSNNYLRNAINYILPFSFVECPLAEFRRARRPKIAPARSIRFDLKLSAALWKCFDDLGSHHHVRRFLRTLARNFHLPAANLRAQQQRRSKLGAFLNAHGAFSIPRTRREEALISSGVSSLSLVTSTATAKNLRRQLVIPLLRFDPIPQLPQRLEQRRLRALVHARNAMKPVNTAAQAYQRRQKPRRCSRIADK